MSTDAYRRNMILIIIFKITILVIVIDNYSSSYLKDNKMRQLQIIVVW